MRTALTRTRQEGFSELVFGKNDLHPTTYYADGRIINLPHNEKLIFDGIITKYAGKEAEYFKRLFKENGIRDLIEEAQEWDGAWSIVYINQNGAVYCFTDPLGKKQLYYNTKGEISSSITFLAAPVVDEFYKSEVGKWGYNTDDRTPWENVKRIMPNRVYMFLGGHLQHVETEPYFDFRWGSSKLDADGFRMLVHNSVKEYLKGLPAGTKSIGVLISGGIDSSIIATELLKLRSEDLTLNFYTINNVDDAPFVKLFAEMHGLKVKTLSYDMDNVDIKNAMDINETPVDLGSMVPNQLMFAAIPEKIIFTGDGPDELFGGYRRIDEYDSQKSDVFQELSFYHLPRLERAASHFGIDLRCPWLSYDIIRYALSLPYLERMHKAPLKEAYKDELPEEIIQRPKLPLKNDKLRADPIKYRHELIRLFFDL